MISDGILFDIVKIMIAILVILLIIELGMNLAGRLKEKVWKKKKRK